MPLFTPINNVDANNSSQAVKELNIYKVNKDSIKYTITTPTKSLDSVPKE